MIRASLSCLEDPVSMDLGIFPFSLPRWSLSLGGGQQEEMHACYCKSDQEPMVRELTEHHGVSQGTEKMEKRICALCPKEHDWSVIYFAPSVNIAAHENCLLYSSGLVECEDRNPYDRVRNFDVKSVKKEIWRGQRLKCSLCKKNGATVGCDESSCAKNYHLLCAKKDQAVLRVDGVRGTYKLFCQQHAPKQEETTQSADCPSLKKKREREKDFSADSPTQPKKKKHDKRHMTVEHLSHTGAVVKVPFLKKCKEAGLLTELFEDILEKMDLMYARLKDETTSDADYKEIETLLLGSGLFEDTLIKFQEVIKRKACEYEERQRQLKQQIEALGDLKEILCSFQENGDLDHSRSTSVSLEDAQLKCQECAEMQAGSEDSL